MKIVIAILEVVVAFGPFALDALKNKQNKY